MEKVLVFGGAGYIGSHCCKLLSESGYRPIVFDNFSTGHRDFVKWGAFEEGDVRNRGKVVDALERHRPVAVMHFAAKSLVGDSVTHPGDYYDSNAGGTLTLLEALRETGIDKLIFSSTCAIYADPGNALIKEDSAKNPISPYGFSKLVCERMMDDFQVAHGLNSVRLRYFNAAGADPACEIGEQHEPETHLVPVVLDVALGRRKSLQVFGVDYATPDGSAVRDYIHVMDIADAHLKALSYLKAGGATVAVNLGTGKGNSVLEIVGAVERVVGHEISKNPAPRRAGDAQKLVASPAEAQRHLNWTAKTANLETIIADAWRWHRKRFSD